MIPKISILLANIEDFEEQDEIIISKAFRVVQNDTQDIYIKKLFLNIDDKIINEKLYNICNFLTNNQFPCFLPPSYISLANEQNNYSAAIFTKYMNNQSLQYIINQQMQGKFIDNYDSTQEYLILYGISYFLECFHSSKKVHGSIKLSNVLLDDNFSPYVSDACLYNLIQRQKNLNFDNIDVSISPETINNNLYTKESDIYSFGILILQVLKHEINVFSDYTETAEQIQQIIKAKTKPTIPKDISSELSKVLDSCFSDPSKRCSASDIKKVFEHILSAKEYEKRFNEFKNKIQPKNEIPDPEMEDLKRKSNIGDFESMLIYGKRLLNQNKKLGMDYLRLAAKNGYIPAKKFYNSYRKNNLENDNNLENEFDNHKSKKSIVHLRDDKSFDQKDLDFDTIIKDVKKNIDKNDTFDIDEKKLLHKNFILTEGAKERLTMLKKYIDAGVPVILEGPTGTSKTLSAEIICELTEREIIRFNLSSETKSTDLLGKFVGDSNSWSGLKMHKGPFYTAFKHGKTLLLDEINLGSTECLQFIEGVLDSGIISVEIPGKPFCEIEMNKNFRLIATQNPNKGLFIHKRQDLGNNFKSRFQVINFPELTDELYDIAIGLAHKYNYTNWNKNAIIRELVDFSLEWSSSNEIKDDIQCFTIREIAATVKALSKGYNIYDTIMTIFGARYQKDKKAKLEMTLRHYSNLNTYQPTTFKYPYNFPKCFQNESLSNALKSIFFSFENHRHVILTGVEGCGITQVARWISHWYQQNNENQSENSINKEYFCVCTNETKCADLIGKHKPSENLNSANSNFELIQWKSGFLIDAIINGYLAVLDNIDEAPSTVTERLNGLLDQKLDENDDKMKYKFEVPENPKQNEVPIHQNFRLLCTCKIDNLIQMSPAFINRFDVVVLENQIQDDEDDLKSLISMLMIQEKPLNFLPDQKVIDLVYRKVHPIITSEQNQDKISMFQLSRICKAVTKYIDFFGHNVNYETIVDFAFDMLNMNQDFKMPSDIEKFLLNNLKTQEENNDNKFFYKKSPNLKSIIAKIYAASLINLPVCLFGPTGVGKTSAAREFARIRPKIGKSNEPFLMYTFHAGTKPKDFYGTTTINNEQVLFINGTLTKAMLNGQTFIADEMNLSSASTMKSLAPALEPISNHSLYIAGVEEPIKVNSEFFFIACQNEIGTNGRNVIPRPISSRFRYFDYPKQEFDDISPICKDIAQSFDLKTISLGSASKVGKYMLELNKLKQRIIPKWSLRDITKLFRRIHYQEENKDLFRNISLYVNILFYTLSPVNKEDVNDVYNDVMKLIVDIFSLNSKQKQMLEICYKSQPIIKNNFLMKCDIGIKIRSIKNTNIFNQLPSLLDSMFKICLSDSIEPILLMGPSGFKTFLAQQNLDEAKIITLNQETTIAQLLGSSTFLSKEEAKLFYIENICKICHPYNEITEYVNQCRNKKLSKEDIVSKINSLPHSFKYAINHLIDKLFNDNDVNTSNCVLSNLVLEFKPGLFLSAILERKSLILKNLSNLPTIILERFNELFSEKHNLILNEDIHNTFTCNEEKELSDIDSKFRVFATCLPNSINRLSEAVLSRFTVICIPEYESKERAIAIKSYIELNNLNFNDELINILIEFSNRMNLYLSKNFSFTQMINSVEMCSRLNKNSNSNKWKNNLGIILYRLGYGLLEKRSKTKNTFIKIFSELHIPPLINNSTNKNPPFILKLKDGYQCLQSNISNICIKSCNIKEINKKVAFTPVFSEMLDVLHLGISINIPIIFEGMPGQGKQTAINYISKMLGYQVINVVISQTTKVEDLFGKITITRDKRNNITIQPNVTKLVEAMKPNSKSIENSIIVFHNINNASSAVLEVLVSIFDQHQKDFLLPNGSTITKGKVKIVGIFNPQNGTVNRDKLPSSLIYSSIYHIVNNPNHNDILSVIECQFEDTGIDPNEAKGFYDKFSEIKKISDETDSPPLTLNDIVKYKKFRNATFNKFNSDIISVIIFAYRFLHHTTISDVIKKIGLNDLKFNPIFTFNEESGKMTIKISNESKDYITLDFDKKVDIDLINTEIASLTLPEKHCIIFLILSILSKQACLIKGETASGKSHVIRLFARMLGKKLIVYQMNSETNISILKGQHVLSNSLSKEDKEDIENALSDLMIIGKIRNYISKNISTNKDEWTRNKFSDLIEYISSYDFGKNQKHEEIIKTSKQKILEALHPAKRFHYEQSYFIKAMEKGEWVLFDGIESAPPEIIEKISSLCSDDPQIDLLECGNSLFFSRDNHPGSKKINENFHLFFTYNHTSQSENKILDPNFLNNCASFTLPSIDSEPQNSAQRILGTLIQGTQSYFPKLSVELATHLSIMHSYAKKESKEDSDSFAGDLQFTGRTINFVSREFVDHAEKNKDPVNEVFRPICNSIKYYYLNSYINTHKKADFKNKMIDEFSKKVENNFMNLTYEGRNLNDKYREILIYLRNIQICERNGKKSYQFNFSDFVQKCFTSIQINEIDFILDHINDTINIIDNSNKDFSLEFSQLKIVASIFYDIKKGKKYLNEMNYSLNLNDDDLLRTKLLDQSLSKFKLLIKIVPKFFIPIIPRALYDSNYILLMNYTIIMLEKNSLDNFKNFISLLNEYPNFIPLIDSQFPYDLFEKTSFKMIHFILPMIRLLHDSKITFNIFVSNDKFSFKYDEIWLFEPTYIIEYENEFKLSSSQIAVNVKTERSIDIQNKIPKDQLIDNESINCYIFNLTKYLADDKQNILRFVKLDKIYYNKINPKKNQISQLSLLLNTKLPSSIEYIYPIVYSFPEKTIKLISNFLLPLEKNMLLSFCYIYTHIDKDNIDQFFNFSNWMLNFCKKCPYSCDIENKIFNINSIIQYKRANEIKIQIENEISYLKNAPQSLPEEIWPIKSFINNIDSVLCEIDDKINEEALNNKKLQLMKKLKPIIDKLERFSAHKYEPLKRQIINEIKKDSHENLSNAKIDFYQIQVNKFIDCIEQRNANNNIKNTICWPKYKLTKEIPKYTSDEVELYQIIIWYSEINSILDKINNPNNGNVYQYILELNEFEEMQDVVKFLSNKFINVNNSNNQMLTSNENSKIIGILNDNFIIKIINKNLINKIDNLHSTLNDLINRNAINDEKTLLWIHKIANLYPPDFCISLPNFQPEDLLHLFIGYDDIEPGLLLKNCFDDNKSKLLERLQCISQNFSNSSQCSLIIAKNIYEIYSNEKFRQPNNFEKMKDYLKNHQNDYYFKLALKVMEVAEKIDHQKKIYFKFDDTFFLREKCITKNEYMNKYPSFVFWLCKNHRCTDNLRMIYRKQSFSKYKLPFWLFTIRLMSSEDCIFFDLSPTTETGKLLVKSINDEIKEQIKKSTNIGPNWLNIILSSPPPEISIQNYQIYYQMFHQFFINLSLSDERNTLQIETFDIKMNQLNRFVKNVFSYVFNNKLNAIFCQQINSNNDIISLIRNPNDFICINIQMKMKDISNDFLNSKEMKNLTDFTKKLKDNINKNLKTLNSIINTKDKENMKKYKVRIEEFKKDEIKKMKSDILKSAKNYKEQFDEITAQEPIKNLNYLQKKCNLLVESLNNLPKCFDETVEPFKLIIFEDKTPFMGSYFIRKIRLNKNDSIDIYNKKTYYFYTKDLDELKKEFGDDVSKFSIIKLFPINIETFDIDKYCQQNYKETKIFTKPTLSFCENNSKFITSYQALLTKITNTSNDVINFVSNLRDELEKVNIKDITFRSPKELTNQIQSLYVYAQYSDNSNCESINDFYKKNIINVFTQLEKYISSIEEQLRNVETMWKASYHRYNLKTVFDDKYKLPIPKFNSNKNQIQLFNKIKYTNFISIPILSVNNGSIVCCFESLNCTLGPFIPSLYSQKIAMNFISFIDEPFTIKLETCPEYSSMFSSKHQFLKGESVQIFISMPNTELKTPEELNIPTKIIFKSEKLNELILPCNFLIQVVPLSLLISCKQSLLSSKDDKFYVCKNEFLSSSKLTFVIQNYYMQEKTNLKYQLISLDENTIIKPLIDYHDDKIELKIPKIDSIKRFHAELRLKFSETLLTSILIDAIVIPFDFEFVVYDPAEKKFDSKATVYYTPKYIDREINLHFKILCPSMSEELKGEINSDEFSYEIKIVKMGKIEKEFFIKKNKEFDITFKLLIANYYYNVQPQDRIGKIDININGIQKSVNLVFRQLTTKIINDNTINMQLLKKLNGYAFKNSDIKWISVHSIHNDVTEFNCFITPFSYYKTSQVKVSYLNNCTLDADDSTFILINEDGEFRFSKSKEAKIEINDSGIFGTFKKFLNMTSDFYPIYGVSDNRWFPVFCDYPQLKWKELDIENAKKDIKIVENARKEIDSFIKSYPNVKNSTNFINLIKLLRSEKVVKKINNLIKYLPANIKSDFDVIIANAAILNSNDPLISVLSYNAIILFKKHFEKRYNETKNNYFASEQTSLTQDEINHQIDKCYNEYCQIDQQANDYLNLPKYKKFKDMNIALSDIQLESKPEKQAEVFLFNEKSQPNLPTPNNQPKYVQFNNSKISDSSNNDIRFELPKLITREDNELPSITIPELNDIYQSAIIGARLLPIYVMKSQNSPKMAKEATNYFYNLLHLFEILPVKDFSFISLTTNMFIESFLSMIGKFKRAGVVFNHILPPKCNVINEKIQDFFQYPDKDAFSIPGDIWNTNKPLSNNSINESSKFMIDSNETKNADEFKEEPNYENKYNKNTSKIGQELGEAMKYKNIELKRIIDDDDDDDDDDNDDGDDDDDFATTDNFQNNNKNKLNTSPVVVSINSIKDKQISSIKFDSMLPKFTEENGIMRAISRMKNMNKNTYLNIIKSEPPQIDRSLFDTNKENFPIKKLIYHSFYFANKFIKKASDMSIQRSKFAVNILVDCSSFISDENKLFNMMIICGLTTALESLEIPYAVAVIADKNFRCVIKSFDEPHSPKCLQKILDCLLIKRYRTKLASSVEYAINTMSFPIDEQTNKRPYRAIYVFSDGLDEQLLLTNAWRQLIQRENLSYGFIFIESSKLKGENLEFVTNVWKNFEHDINLNNPIAILKIASIKAEICDEVSTKLVNLFEIVMKRFSVEINPNETYQFVEKYEDAIFSIDEKLSSISKFSYFINSDYHMMKEIYTNSEQILKTASLTIDKLNPMKYRNKLKKIASCEFDKPLKKEEFSDFLKHFLISKEKINQASLETIFKPNKASQLVLSTSGTDFDITALILNLLNPVPDPMIYLEEKGGLIRNYGISIVVDSSISCFDELSGPHSFQTLQNILSSLATLDISCFDLIVSGSPHPIVVCSEVDTIHALSKKSSLYKSLLAILQNPTHNTDLSSAIRTAFDLRRMRSSDHASILFVLTNGLYNDNECKRIVDNVNICVQSGITTFGIGIGNYPKGIENLFPQVVYSLNPANVMKAIASFYGNSISSVISEIEPINFEPPKIQDLISTFNELIENEKKPIFDSLKNELKNIMPTLDAFDDMYNMEQNIGDAIKGYSNPVGANTELYVKDLLKTQKILIVMLWDRSLNEMNEEHFVHPYYINTPSEKGAGCIKTAVEHFGITLTIVRNYEDAIEELTKQTKPGFCDYYATWVFCGPPLCILPKELDSQEKKAIPNLVGSQENSDPNLVGQFNEVLILFWKNGGSIVFWAEGYPLTYQVNLFLEAATFEKEKDCPTGKVSFRIEGEHKGTNILLGEESDILKNVKTFNRMKRCNKKYERTKLSHNIGKIYEGITISYAPYDLEAIKPFKPFSRDSNGGISALFYEANCETGTGDIVIDCGYTKCFTKMSTDGTFRYVQNIAGWTARPEVHKIIDNEEPSEWRPKSITYQIQKGVFWDKFQILPINPKNLQTLWAIDASDSVRGNPFYHSELQKVFKEYYKEGDDLYLWSDYYEKITYNELQAFISNRQGRNKGTLSSLIAEIAEESSIHEHLLIVTDGSVNNGEIDKSDDKMKKLKFSFQFVTTFIIQDDYDPTTRENLNDPNTRSQLTQQYLNEIKIKPDLSVGAPYSRGCQNITYYIKGHGCPPRELASLKSDDINALNNIDSIANYSQFAQHYDKLDHAIQASTLGQSKNTDLLEKLRKLKKRVINSGLNSQQRYDFNEKFEVLHRMANGALRNTFKLEDIAAAKRGVVY